MLGVEFQNIWELLKLKVTIVQTSPAKIRVCAASLWQESIVSKLNILRGLASISLTLIACIGGVAVAQADSSDLAIMLNKANQINYQEIQMAKMAESKAGDNLALFSMAETMKADYQANAAQLKALAAQQKVKIEPTQPWDAVQTKLQNANGGDFNEVFLDAQIAGHEQALAYFKSQQQQFAGDPDVTVYLGQTIPIIRAHLEMAQNLRADIARGSSENPANNKTETSENGSNRQNQ